MNKLTMQKRALRAPSFARPRFRTKNAFPRNANGFPGTADSADPFVAPPPPATTRTAETADAGDNGERFDEAKPGPARDNDQPSNPAEFVRDEFEEGPKTHDFSGGQFSLDD